MKILFRLLVALPLISLLLGCAITNPPIRTTTANDGGLIYGYFDMSDSLTDLDSVWLNGDERVGISIRQSPMNTDTSGLFFMESVAPMRYVIPHFYTVGAVGGDVFHGLRPGDQDIFDVAPGDMIFMGAYKYVPIGKGSVWWEPDEFDLKPLRSVSEAQVLKMLRARVQDARWKRRIGARLSQLGRSTGG